MEIRIDGFHCYLESTSGRRARRRNRVRRRGSDEVAFFLAVLGLDGSAPDGGRYTEEQSFRIRSKSDVDSNESHTFEHPISVRTTPGSSSRLVEVHALGYELDGAGSVDGLASDIHDAIRAEIERELAPGTPTRPYRLFRRFGLKDNLNQGVIQHDMLWTDVWHVDLDNPLEGGHEPAPNVRTIPEGSRQFLKIGRPTIELFDVEPGFRIERRTYNTPEQYSIYSFDTRYVA